MVRMPALVLEPRACELDAVAIEAAQAGDRHARRRLVLVYQDRVFHLLRRMLGPSGVGPDAIEDFAQEVFLRAFVALARFDVRGPAKLSTWLLTIATRRAIDALRDASRRPRSHGDPDAHAPSTTGRVGDLLLATLLERAMATLTADQKAVFVLREYHGLDYEEIARVVGVSPGTVGSRLARARAILQSALEGATQ
jgi:RNA polymerase sigma-70 factor (ECF subfamily)